MKNFSGNIRHNIQIKLLKKKKGKNIKKREKKAKKKEKKLKRKKKIKRKNIKKEEG